MSFYTHSILRALRFRRDAKRRHDWIEADAWRLYLADYFGLVVDDLPGNRVTVRPPPRKRWDHDPLLNLRLQLARKVPPGRWKREQDLHASCSYCPAP